MAEILGVVASSISVAQLVAQLSTSIVTLMSYVDKIKDAPEDIRALVEGFEDFRYLLEEVEKSQAQCVGMMGYISTTRSLVRCKRAVDCLQTVLEELGVDPSCVSRRRKRWPVAILWKQAKIEKLRSNIATARSCLTLSCLIHNRYNASNLDSIIAAIPSTF
jgi:hypothetical protein